ncbi:Serine/threonine-protein kinase PINK1, mitochondrial [Armadillidium nasatum]|uniref:non-specific serine/threonine protein kinase n=1 Tax=Armadillidium nasatum TaxID=96803 RepID=A0A5N5SN31_9CRUS|nr:Serine/threonine-protein kinase PINK1, mitochondrial [Armadillidium nasatum]
MISLKTIIEGVVEQGRRAILQATRAKINQAGNTKPPKLSEVQKDKVVCRPRPRGVSNQLSAIETKGSLLAANTTLSVASGPSGAIGGGIVKLLRPVTSRIVQGLVRRVSSPLWTEARRRSAKRLFGETAPYFALVGVTLVSGPERGLLTAQDEMEAICGDIREAISRAGWIYNPGFWKETKGSSFEEEISKKKGFSLADFEIGSFISKGSNAVVYAAKFIGKDTVQEGKVVEESLDSVSMDEVAEMTGENLNLASQVTNNSSNSAQAVEDVPSIAGVSYSPVTEPDDQIPALSCLKQNSSHFSEYAESIRADYDSEDTYSYEESNSPTLSEGNFDLRSTFHSLNSLNDGNFSSQSSLVSSNLKQRNSVSLCEDINLLLSSGGFQTNRTDDFRKLKKVKFKIDEKVEERLTEKNEEIQNESENQCQGPLSSSDNYPLAMKMMFNYEAESNAPAILTAMYKEMIPSKSIELDDVSALWKDRLLNSTTTLPPHPNIVNMPCVFVDKIPLLSEGLKLYPDALPKRINPSGYGRNMSLFCVMKRYDCTLTEYLHRHKPSIRTSVFLLTQMFEAVRHINKYSVAHRDLKADNILLCLNEGIESPHLVLSDFGCCLLDSYLSVAFSSYEADPRVGNAALMAPEIKSSTPGMFTWLNYSKSDLWAAGTIAYEIFGMENPFVSNRRSGLSSSKKILDSASYKEQELPRFPKTVPTEIRYLLQDILRRNPNRRPSPTVAATICQLSLWGPRKWLNRHMLSLPSHNEMRWLLCVSTKVLCEAGSVCTSKEMFDGNSDATTHDNDNHNPRERIAVGQLEYEIVSTFLKRVRYSDIIDAIKWIRAF